MRLFFNVHFSDVVLFQILGKLHELFNAPYNFVVIECVRNIWHSFLGSLKRARLHNY